MVVRRDPKTRLSFTLWYRFMLLVVLCVAYVLTEDTQSIPAERRISVSQYYNHNDNTAAAAGLAPVSSPTSVSDAANKNKMRQEASSAHYQRNHEEISPDEEDSLFNYRKSQHFDRDTVAVGSVEEADINGIRKGTQFVRGSVVSPDEPGEEAQETINTGTYNHRVPQYIHASPAHDLSLENGASIKNHLINNNYVQSYSSQSNHHYSPSDFIQDPSYQLDFKYHDYDKLTKYLRTTSSRYPNLTALYSIGKSVQGMFSN